MAHTLSDQTLALAGIFQAAHLVQQVARRGLADTDALETCLYSVFQVDAPSVEAVYGDAGRLRSGLQVLIQQIDHGRGRRDLEITRYAASLMHLERRLARQPQVLERIAEGIERAQRQREHFSLMHDNVIEALAALYSETISHIPPRIMVSGEPRFLAVPANAARIRALLLAGIRSAVLWRQCGGSRWRLLWHRRALVADAERRLKAEPTTVH